MLRLCEISVEKASTVPTVVSKCDPILPWATRVIFQWVWTEPHFSSLKKKKLSLSRQTNQSCFSKSLRSDLPKIFVELEEADFSCSVCVCVCVCVCVYMCERETERQRGRGKQKEREIKRPAVEPTQHMIFALAVLQAKKEGQKEKSKTSLHSCPDWNFNSKIVFGLKDWTAPSFHINGRARHIFMCCFMGFSPHLNV